MWITPYVAKALKVIMIRLCRQPDKMRELSSRSLKSDLEADHGYFDDYIDFWRQLRRILTFSGAAGEVDF